MTLQKTSSFVFEMNSNYWIRVSWVEMALSCQILEGTALCHVYCPKISRCMSIAFQNAYLEIQSGVR